MSLPKPTVLFVVTSLAAMTWLAFAIARLASDAIPEGGPDLLVATCCFPIGIIHIAAIFWSLFHRGIQATYLALSLYCLETIILAWTMTGAIVRHPELVYPWNWPDLLTPGTIVFWILCIFPAWRWLRRLKRVTAATAVEPPDTPVG